MPNVCCIKTCTFLRSCAGFGSGPGNPDIRLVSSCLNILVRPHTRHGCCLDLLITLVTCMSISISPEPMSIGDQCVSYLITSVFLDQRVISVDNRVPIPKQVSLPHPRAIAYFVPILTPSTQVFSLSTPHPCRTTAHFPQKFHELKF